MEQHGTAPNVIGSSYTYLDAGSGAYAVLRGRAYQAARTHPEWIALGLAILLPVLRGLYRWKKRIDAQRM
jgi:hypothetical protein